MDLDLVDRGNGASLVRESIQMRRLEVRDTDAASASVLREFFEDFPRGDEVTTVERRQGPMNEEQVDVIGIQSFQRPIERAARVVGLVEAVVELAGDENVGPVEAGVANALADSLLVAIHLRGVDVSVADLQGRPDRRGGLARIDLIHTETKLRDAHTIVEFDHWNLAHGLPPSFVHVPGRRSFYLRPIIR